MSRRNLRQQDLAPGSDDRYGHEIWDAQNAENHLVAMIYRFANDPRHWFQLLTGISQCLRYQPDQQASRLLPDIGRRLMPHFQQAISICGEMALLDSASHQAQLGLDQLAHGQILLDQHGRVLLINRAARGALAEVSKVYMADEQLWLREALGDVRFPAGHHIQEGGYSFDSVALGDKGQHLITVQRAKEVEGAFPQDWQFTETEARVARALLQHDSAKEIARELAISEHTVRDHLAALYRKTGVDRKASLIQLLLASQLFGDSIEQSLANLPGAQLPPVQILQLSDGRKMSYVVHGKLQHRAVVLCHNFMGSALELPPSAYALLDELELCIIVPERPGYGDSDFKPGLSHASWCADLEALLAALGIDRFSLIGHSMGCNYAMHACELLGDRVEHYTMVSPMVRYEDVEQCPQHTTLTMRTTQRCVKYAPFLLKPMMQLMIRSDVETFYERKEEVFSPTPPGHASPQQRLYHLLEKPYFVANLQRSVKQGVDAWAAELVLNFKPWRAQPKPHIGFSIWHGARDDQVPLPMVEHMHRELDGASLTVLDEEGHGFLMRHVEDVLRAHRAALPGVAC